MPLDGLLAECEAQPVSRVFFAVQALKHSEDAALECGLYTGTVVGDGEHPIGIHQTG
jgi:putative NIF3 family GTP cyclohydrolase 1 type 2